MWSAASTWKEPADGSISCGKKPERRAFQDALVALSLAHLTFFRIWPPLLAFQTKDTYLMESPPRPAEILAALFNLAWLAALVWLALCLVRRRPGGRLWSAGLWAFLLFLLLPLNAFRSVLANRIDLLRSPLFQHLGARNVYLSLGLLAMAAAAAVIFWREPLVWLAVRLLVILSPAVLFNFGQAAWGIIRYSTRIFPRPSLAAPLVPARHAPRVLWIVFDKWSWRLTFPDRPPGWPLPAIDRLRSRSLDAANAYSPGNETVVSMPALITGRMVSGARAAGAARAAVDRPWRAAAGFLEHAAECLLYRSRRRLQHRRGGLVSPLLSRIERQPRLVLVVGNEHSEQ